MDRYDEFLGLHVQGEPLLLANAVDIGTAKALAFLGFSALATTSAGHAATPLPVNADLELLGLVIC